MNLMKGLARAAVAVVTAAALFAACSKDKEPGSIRFDRPALYLTEGATATAGFSLDNTDARTLSVTSKPSGWEAELDAAGRTLTVTAPASSAEDADASGSIVLNGVSEGGIVSGTLFVGIAREEDFSARPANSYIASRKQTEYRFDALHAGDGKTALATARIGIVWQSQASLVQYPYFDGTCGSFYVGAADGGNKEGNALIGAYDAQGKLIWSWHVWVSDFDPDENPAVLNGRTLMARNLGALADSHATDEEKLASYGLFYQWGRKEPFVGPLAYNAASGSSAAMYGGDGTRIYLKTTASSAETGTTAYAVEHPLEFLTVEEKDDDWLQEAAAGARWSGAGKSVYDPCPYGWRVAPEAAFDDLSIRDDLQAEDAAYESQYGWTLGDGTAESFFPGAGRRSWRDGTVQNYFDESLPVRALEMQPWVGYYWTADADGTLASAFCFWYKAGDAAASGVRNGRAMGRANGMSVRCVRDE